MHLQVCVRAPTLPRPAACARAANLHGEAPLRAARGRLHVPDDNGFVTLNVLLALWDVLGAAQVGAVLCRAAGAVGHAGRGAGGCCVVLCCAVLLR